MSLAVAKSADAPRVPPPYLELYEVAERLGLSAGHLRRRCTTQWGPDGLAKQFGNVWGVHPGADQRLRTDADIANRDREQIAALTQERVSPKQIDRAQAIRDIVVGLADFECDTPNPRSLRAFYIAHLTASGQLADAGIKTLSVTTFYRWERNYRANGIRGLARKSSTPTGESVNGKAAIQYIFNLIHCGNPITLATAITIATGEAVKHHKGDPAWKIGSYNSVRAEINRISPPIMTVLAAKGDNKAKAGCVPKGHRDFEAIPSNAEWDGDERTLDVWCRVLTSRGWKAVRPKITAWKDMRSRMIVGWVLDVYADSNTILASIKTGISRHGKPSLLRVDWGQDYKKATGSPHSKRWKVRSFDGARIGSVLDELGIEVSPVMPYTPWSKPIESFFKTMKEHMDKLLASFWGGCPSERHADRHRYIREHLHKLPTIDDLRQVVATFVDVYHRTPHTSVDMFGKSPLEAMEAFRDGPAKMESDRVLDHYFQEFIGPKLVRRDGIKHNKYWYGHGDPRLVALQGRKVLLSVQPDDASRAMVCELDRSPKFRVECAPLRGFTQRDAADLAKEHARLLRPYKDQRTAARKFFNNTTPAELQANQLAGIEAKHGKCVPTEVTPPTLTIRPELEDALENAGPAPSEGVSIAVRTGTDDDEITVDDMLAGDDRIYDPAWPPVAKDDDTDFFGLNDIGE